MIDNGLGILLVVLIIVVMALLVERAFDVEDRT